MRNREKYLMEKAVEMMFRVWPMSIIMPEYRNMSCISIVRNLIRTLCRYLFFVWFLPALSENLRLLWVLLKIVEPDMEQHRSPCGNVVHTDLL